MNAHAVLALAVTLLAWVSAFGQTASPSDVVKQYRKNADAFPYCRCTFTLTDGEGAVDEKTDAITWRKKSSAVCRLAVDGEYEAYEQHGNAKAESSKQKLSEKDGHSTVGAVRVEGMLFVKLVRGPTTHGQWINVFENMNLLDRQKDPSEGLVFSPLDFGFGHRLVGDPREMIQTPDAVVTSALGERSIDGRRCVGLHFDIRKGEVLSDVWFDPAQGMIPYRREVIANGKLESRTVITAARNVSGDRWFPSRIVRQTFGKRERVTEYALGEVDVDRRPTPDDLSVTLPAGTAIMNGHTGNLFKLRQAEKVSGYDLPELFEKTEQAKRGEVGFDTAIEHRGSKASVWFWVCGGLGLMLVAFGGYRWVRNRRRRADDVVIVADSPSP